LTDGEIVERFDCYEGTPAKAKLSKDLYVQGINFFARKPDGRSDRVDVQKIDNHRITDLNRGMA
jgi:hypothetical protein